MTADVAELQRRTVGGLLAYCEYLMTKGYASSAQISPWRTAIQKVFEAVEGERFVSLDLSSIDIDEYMQRFQTLAGGMYKSESITAYKRRVQNAIEAHEHYLSTGRPPTFRQGGKRMPKDDAAKNQAATPEPTVPAAHSASTDTNGLIDYPFILKDGRMVVLRMPPRLTSDDVNRLSGFLRMLQDDPQEQRQLPSRTSDQSEAA